MINVAVVGYGYWGPNLTRCFSQNTDTNLMMICDLSADRIKHAQLHHPQVKTTHDFSSLLKDPKIDVIGIATPVQTHYELALAALKAGKHVLLEKPMTETSIQAKHLLEEADARNLILMIDHTFLFTPAVKKIRELVQDGELGNIYFYDSTRVNLGLFRHDVNVIWDLAIHDLSILDYVLNEYPLAISATGATHVRGGVENSAFITLFFQGSTLAHINVNWLSPVKIRQTLIGGSRKMIHYDDLNVTEKIKVYDRGLEVENNTESEYEILKGYRTGDMWSPNLSSKEALLDEIEHFIECIKENRTPLTDGVRGMRMVQLLETATVSMKQRGIPIEFK